jgi:hypothetical protein
LASDREEPMMGSNSMYERLEIVKDMLAAKLGIQGFLVAANNHQ